MFSSASFYAYLALIFFNLLAIGSGCSTFLVLALFNVISGSGSSSTFLDFLVITGPTSSSAPILCKTFFFNPSTFLVIAGSSTDDSAESCSLEWVSYSFSFDTGADSLTSSFKSSKTADTDGSFDSDFTSDLAGSPSSSWLASLCNYFILEKSVTVSKSLTIPSRTGSSPYNIPSFFSNLVMIGIFSAIFLTHLVILWVCSFWVDYYYLAWSAS